MLSARFKSIYQINFNFFSGSERNSKIITQGVNVIAVWKITVWIEISFHVFLEKVETSKKVIGSFNLMLQKWKKRFVNLS